MAFPTTRLRRLRSSSGMRRLVAETRLSPQSFVWPAFVVEGKGVREPISAMPGVHHLSIDMLLADAGDAHQHGVGAVLLFGVPEKRDGTASAATDRDGIVPRAVRELKDAMPDLLVITDVCLCAYTDHGHCGVLGDGGRIANDASLELLSSMALAHAEAGADIVAPSDMMDGRVAHMRRALDGRSLSDVAIMSYAAKYASCFYGPFREAAHSAPSFGDRKSYQMDPANVREALREVKEDIAEGADIVMVKPAMSCLDVIARVREKTDLPLAAYQVSGEYSMIAAASEKGWLDRERAMIESLTAIRRAGADIIITYFAREAAKLLG